MHEAFKRVVTNHSGMQAILRLAERVAPTDTNVLILGETGTGKELMAKAIHGAGLRADKPFVVVNCAAVPEHLVESELFGYKKGAFTDAREDRAGKFEIAHTGTVFLDEVAELTPGAQAKLLRVIETKTVERLGDAKGMQVDVRILAATNAEIEKRVEQNRFRADLYYRLNEVKLEIPPLRQRKGDIPALVQCFIAEYNQEFGKSVRGISNTALAVLERYHFPGNVRELRSIIKRAMILIDSHRDTIWLEHLPLDIRIRPEGLDESDDQKMITLREWIERLPIGIPLEAGRASSGRVKEEEPTLDDMEKAYIEELLRRYQGNKSRVARILGINRTTLYKKLRAHGMG